jgi:hypothetical protein
MPQSSAGVPDAHARRYVVAPLAAPIWDPTSGWGSKPGRKMETTFSAATEAARAVKRMKAWRAILDVDEMLLRL